MSQRKLLVIALVFAALAAAASAAVDFFRHGRVDSLALSLTVALAMGAGWVYTRIAA